MVDKEDGFMGGFTGFDPRLNLSGFTALPNLFFDEVMAQVDSMAELKIILAVFRKTYGWLAGVDDKGQPIYKQQDAISYSQLQDLTGMSSPSVSAGLTKAIDDGYIVKVEQGNHLGKSSVYRVRLKEDGPPGDSGDREPLPEPEPPKPSDTPKDIIETEINKPNGLATKDVENVSKADLLKDFFGGPTEPEPTKKKKGASGWKSKNRELWNCNDLLSFYRDMFEVNYGISFGHITGKERANAKALCEGYGTETVAKVADYLFNNFGKLHYLPQDYPNFSIFYGWFKTLHADSLGLKKGDMKTREYDETKHIDRKGVNTW